MIHRLRSVFWRVGWSLWEMIARGWKFSQLFSEAWHWYPLIPTMYIECCSIFWLLSVIYYHYISSTWLPHWSRCQRVWSWGHRFDSQHYRPGKACRLLLRHFLLLKLLKCVWNSILMTLLPQDKCRVVNWVTMRSQVRFPALSPWKSMPPAAKTLFAT